MGKLELNEKGNPELNEKLLQVNSTCPVGQVLSESYLSGFKMYSSGMGGRVEDVSQTGDNSLLPLETGPSSHPLSVYFPFRLFLVIFLQEMAEDMPAAVFPLSGKALHLFIKTHLKFSQSLCMFPLQFY